MQPSIDLLAQIGIGCEPAEAGGKKARRPYATLSKIFDFVKVTEGAQRPRQSMNHWIASLRSQ
jgi:hypothetical protein